MDPLLTLAHVKWFAQVHPHAEPMRKVLSPAFLGAWALGIVAALVLTRLNVPLQELGFVQRIHAALDRLRPYSHGIIRIGMAVPLLGAAWSGFLLHFELAPVPMWVRLGQAAAGLLLLIPGATGAAGAALTAALYGVGIAFFGLHHMLDYVAWLGACFFVLSAGRRWHTAAIPVLYISTGISLAWAAVEKWAFPAMGADILARHGLPTFGFPPDLFLMLAGWVELGVAYLLITGVLNRFLSLVVTLLFVSTSMVFGAQEILGHWQLHAALFVFLTEGTGAHVTPVLWHRGIGLQMAFVGVTLVPFVAGFLWLYYLLMPA